jgi:hypothetical protein
MRYCRRLAVALLLAMGLAAIAVAAHAAPKDVAFLVKLGDTLDTRASRPGDNVSAVVISPVSLRGGRLEGTVEEARGGRLRFSFHTLRHAGKTFSLRTQITGVVNSKGDVSRDDLGQVVRIEEGTIVASGKATAIHEGAEIRLAGELP